MSAAREESVTQMFSMQAFQQQYATRETRVTIKGREFQFFLPESLEPFMNADDPMADFPLWAKMWEASALLAGQLAERQPRPGETLLEIGAGIGMVGIVAAAFGHQVTLTEYNPDALNFARANAEANGCPQVKVEYLDWLKPVPLARFDLIVGSEVIYQVEMVPALLSLFQRYLAPGGTILIAEQVRETGLHFWEAAQADFQIKARRHTMHSHAENLHLATFELKCK
jgi:predicted nicotinamide N-methyase